MSRKPTVSSGPIASPTKAESPISGLVSSGESVIVHSVDISCNTACNAGWGYVQDAADFEVYLWDDSAGASATLTTDAFTMFTNTNNDGFVISSKNKFNILALDVNVAPSGGSPAYDYSYWDGSAWSAVTRFESPSYSNSAYAYIGFHTPVDWALSASGDTPVDTDGLPANRYLLRVRATTAPSTQNGTTDGISVIRLLGYIEGVAAAQVAYSEYANGHQLPIDRNPIAYTSVADSANYVTFEYRPGK